MEKKGLILKLSITICILLIVIAVLNIGLSISRKNKLIIAVQSSLTSVQEIKELQTVEYEYNSYAISYGTKYSVEEYESYKPIAENVTACKKAIDNGTYAFEELPEKLADFEVFWKRYLDYKKEYADYLELGITDKALNTVGNLKNAITKSTGVKDFLRRTSNGNDERKANFEEKTKEIENEKKNYADFISLGETNTIQLLKELYESCDGKYEDFCNWENFLSQSRNAVDKASTEERYAVAYKGIVVAGINEDINIKIDEQNSKKLLVCIPPVRILDIIIEIPSDKENKSVIAKNTKYTSSVNWTQEAFKLCRADLRKKATENEVFMTMAKENVKNTVTALVEPLLENTKFTFEIVEE